MLQIYINCSLVSWANVYHERKINLGQYAIFFEPQNFDTAYLIVIQYTNSLHIAPTS